LNNKIQEYVKTREPMIENLKGEERRIYKAGLMMLGMTVCEDFLDIPELSSHKYETNGLFYEIPYFSSEQLWTQDNQRILLVVYKIENRSSYCPLRIDFKHILKEDTIDYWLYVYDQSGDKTIKWELTAHENGKSYTTIHKYETIKLSELIGYNKSIKT
jgi:hypothetical protein